MLSAPGDAVRLQVLDEGGAAFGRRLELGPVASVADDCIVRVGVDVEDWCEGHVHVARAEFTRDDLAGGARGFDRVGTRAAIGRESEFSLGCYLVASCQSSMGPVLWCSPDGRGGRDVREMRWPEPPDAPAFLVDHD